MKKLSPCVRLTVKEQNDRSWQRVTYHVRLQDAATNKIMILKISLIRSGPKVKRILLVARCTSTTEYPSPKFILTRRSTARTTSSGLPQSRRLCGKEEPQRRERVFGWIRKRVIQSLRRRCESVPMGKKTLWRSEKITGQEGVWRVADEIFMNGGDIHRQSD